MAPSGSPEYPGGICTLRLSLVPDLTLVLHSGMALESFIVLFSTQIRRSHPFGDRRCVIGASIS